MKNNATQTVIFTEALSGAFVDIAREMGYKVKVRQEVAVFVKQDNTLSKITGFMQSKKSESIRLTKSAR